MLVSRLAVPEHSHWSSKFEGPLHHKSSPDKSRMSDLDAPLSTSPDWQGQYSFLSPGDGDGVFSTAPSAYDHVSVGGGGGGNSSTSTSSISSTSTTSTSTSTTTTSISSAPSSTAQPDHAVHSHSSPVPRPRSATVSSVLDTESRKPTGEAGAEVQTVLRAMSSPILPQRRSLDPLGLRSAKQPSPIPEQAERPAEQQCANAKTADAAAGEGMLAPAETQALGPVPGPGPVPGTAPVAEAPETYSAEREIVVAQTGMGGPPNMRDDDDEVLDDEDMLEDAEGSETGAPQQPITAAERTAHRRKMKRFRYVAKKQGRLSACLGSAR